MALAKLVKGLPDAPGIKPESAKFWPISGIVYAEGREPYCQFLPDSPR